MIGALERIFLARRDVASLIGMLVGVVLAVGFPVAHPGPGDATTRAVASEFPCAAFAYLAVLGFVGAIGAVGVTVALPGNRNALVVFAFKLVATTVTF